MLTQRRAPQARPAPAHQPAAGPLPRGYIQTGDLMPSPAMAEATRVDITDAGYQEALQRAARPSSYAEGRLPTLPAPAKTVYVTLNRPDGLRAKAWRQLVAAVDLTWAPGWVVQRMATELDAEQPAVTWVVLVPPEIVVAVQQRLVEAIGFLGPLAHLIWAEATPRTLRVVE